MILSFSLAFLAGVSIVVARIINANLGDEIGIFSSTFFNYLVGFIISLFILLFTNELSTIINLPLTKTPFLGYWGGFLGVIVVSLSSFTSPKISAFYMTLFCFIGQLFVGIIIDYIILKSISPGKIIGGILVLIGLTYNLNVDKKATTIEVCLSSEENISN